jgi:nucleoside-diphosphate-sugar epimerase
MHVVIARGSGFIGSHLVERYLAHGHRVTAVDDLQTGALTNLARVLQHPRFRFEVSEPRGVGAVEPGADLRLEVAADGSTVEIVAGPLDVRTARIVDAYGPRMRGDENVMGALLARAMPGGPLCVPGNGPRALSFVYVDDVVEGVMRLAAGRRAAGRCVDFGTEETATLLELANCIGESAGVGVRLTSVPVPALAPVRALPDPNPARALLGWRPRIGLREGIGRTLAAATARLRAAG